jgi:uncharacterized protein YndB with AHSA1/START domain
MTATAGPTDVPPGRAADAAVIEVSRVAPLPIDEVWRVLTTSDGAEALLGSGAHLGGKGERWRSADGSHGVVRSYHPMEQIRISWHADEHGPATLVELNLTREGEGTRLGLRHEQIPGDATDKSLQQRWEAALGRIGANAT